MSLLIRLACIALAAASAVAAAPSPAPTIASVADFRAAPPVGRLVRIVGYVVDGYFCPPCPPGAECKPCAIPSTVFVADAPGHAPFALSTPPADVIALSADPAKFANDSRYRFEIRVEDRSSGPFDGVVLRSQDPDRDPPWTDPPPPAPGASPQP